MQYGFFDDARREYVITRPDTPLPWLNYLGNRDFISLISNTAGGYSFYRDARLRRLTRYRYNNVPMDAGGRYIYVRDDATGEFWSPTWQPVRRPVENYACRHGQGYTVISSSLGGIQSEVVYLVPLDENLEIWQLTVRNARASTARLTIYSCVEFCLWDAQDDATNLQRNLNTGEVEAAPLGAASDGGASVPEGAFVIYHKTEYRERRNHFAYFACSGPVQGYETQREAFLGPYRGWDNPVAVEKGSAANSLAYGWAPVGSHRVTATLEPGESRTTIFLLGYGENPEAEKFDPRGSQTLDKRRVKPVIARYLNATAVDTALVELHRHWDERLGRLQVDTPDEHTNRMVNVWNAYQCMTTLNLSRSASLFETGIGRGIGFRDSNQDLLGYVHMAPERARQRILDLAATQLPTGGAYHQYQPLTKRGNDAVGGNFNDDPLWLVVGTAAYLKETGDWSILDKNVPFDNAPGSEAPLYVHLQASIAYTLDRLGPHGLPLIGRADWNDCLNLNAFSTAPGESFQTTTSKDGKVAESVFIAALFVLAAKEMADIAERHADLAAGGSAEAVRYRAAAEQMARAVVEHGWDGEWFLRAYDDRGCPVGSHTCEEGKLYIEPQGMAAMAGIGLDDGCAERALNAVAEQLTTPHGIMLLQPAYSRYHVELGEISSYPPGYKENAGVFCHTNPWIMIAEARLGRGDRAFDYYSRINPSAREGLSDLHRCEPYVYAQMIAGRDAPTHGEAKNSWLTGTAAWNYVAITQWMLGIRPTYDGLRIAPVLPSSWNGYRAARVFRGVMYQIHVSRDLTRTDGRGKTRVFLKVNEHEIEGDVVPLPAPGETRVTVEAVMRDQV